MDIVDHCDEIECPNCGEALEEEWCCQSDNEGNEHDCLMGYKCTNDECGIRFHPNGEEI